MAAGPSALRLLLSHLGLTSPTRSTQYPSRGSRPSGLASPEEWRGRHAYPSALTATSARRSLWAEPTPTSVWGKISLGSPVGRPTVGAGEPGGHASSWALAFTCRWA
jgi:hypothetical protein